MVTAGCPYLYVSQTDVTATEATGFRFECLIGTQDRHPDEFYEDRLSRPIDLYTESARDMLIGKSESTRLSVTDDRIEISQVFLHVETDAGVSDVGKFWV